MHCYMLLLSPPSYKLPLDVVYCKSFSPLSQKLVAIKNSVKYQLNTKELSHNPNIQMNRKSCSETYFCLNVNQISLSLWEKRVLFCWGTNNTVLAVHNLTELFISKWSSRFLRKAPHSIKGLFTWRWGTSGRWGTPPTRGQKKLAFTCNPGALGWGLKCLSYKFIAPNCPFRSRAFQAEWCS